ncbi:advillin-like, partial [Aphelenchoides avenae]
DDWDCHEEFFRWLGAKPSPPISNPVVDDDEYERCPTHRLRLFRVCDATGEVVISEVPPPLLKASLDSEVLEADCFFLHCGISGVFCWVGSKCTERERREVWNYAKEYLKEAGLPAHTPICRINEGYEPTVFRLALDWPRDQVKPGSEPTSSNAGKNTHDLHTANVARMCSKPKTSPLTDQFAYDDGCGDVKVWRVVKFSLQEVPRREHGLFYSGDSYVIFYKSHRIHNGIVYFWLGNTSTVDEKASAAMFVHQVDQRESRGHALQIRVIQMREPEHFLRVFGGMLVFLRGGVMSGFRRFRMEARYGLEIESNSGVLASSTKLYQIRDRRVVEVEPKGSSLNSNDIFVLARPDIAYQWIGVGSNEMERQTVYKFIRRMENIPYVGESYFRLRSTIALVANRW